MTVTHSTLTSEPTKSSMDRLISYLRHPPWARNFIAGLVPSNNATDATNDLDFTAGVATDTSNDEMIELLTAMTKRADAAWAEGTNQGMLDTGAVGNSTYHIFLIKNRKSGKVDILSSLSATAPAMPSGYTYKRRLLVMSRSGGVNAIITSFLLDGTRSANQPLAAVLTAAQGGIAAGALENWHEIGAASEPVFNSSWVNYGAGLATAAFRKDADGVVHIKGTVKNGTVGIAVAFTLPAGYRPALREDFVTIGNGAIGQVVVNANGEVWILAGSNVNHHLNTVSFVAEQ